MANNDNYLENTSFDDKEIIEKYILASEKAKRENLYDLFKLRTWLPLYVLYDEIKSAKENPSFDTLTQNEKINIYGQALVYEIVLDTVRIAGICGVYLAHDFLFW